MAPGPHGMESQKEWFEENWMIQLPLHLQLIGSWGRLADMLRITELFFKCVYVHLLWSMTYLTNKLYKLPKLHQKDDISENEQSYMNVTMPENIQVNSYICCTL